LTEYLSDENLLLEIARSARQTDWAKAVWRFALGLRLSDDTEKALALSFIDVAQRFTQLPAWTIVPGEYGTHRHAKGRLNQHIGHQHEQPAESAVMLLLQFLTWRAIESIAQGLPRDPPRCSEYDPCNVYVKGSVILDSDTVRRLQDRRWVAGYEAANLSRGGLSRAGWLR
jgi:hypothetical protein